MFAWLSKFFSSSLSAPQEAVPSAADRIRSNGEFSETTQEPPTARNAAYHRLRLVLMHDRTQLEPSVLEQMRVDIVQVISKYVHIDEGAIEINLETDTETNTVALVASIPMVSARRGLAGTSEEKQTPSEGKSEGKSESNNQGKSEQDAHEPVAALTL